MRRRGTVTHLRFNVVDPLHQLAVELRADAEAGVNAVFAFDQAGQNVVDVADRKGIVTAQHLGCGFRADATAGPDFLLFDFFLTEQHVLAVLAAGNQHQYGMLFGKAAEVIEIGILAERMLDIAVAHRHRRGRHNGDAVRAHQLHQLTTTFRVFARVQFHTHLRTASVQGFRRRDNLLIHGVEHG